MRKLIENIDFTIDVNKLPAKLRYRRRLRGGGGRPGWCHPRVEAVREVDTPGQEAGISAHGPVSPGQMERAQFRTASFGGQSCRSADGFHHSGDNYCTTGPSARMRHSPDFGERLRCHISGSTANMKTATRRPPQVGNTCAIIMTAVDPHAYLL